MDQEKIWFGLYSEQKCLQRCCPFTTQPTDQLCVCCSYQICGVALFDFPPIAAKSSYLLAKVPFDVNSELALLYDLFGAEVATKLLNPSVVSLVIISCTVVAKPLVAPSSAFVRNLSCVQGEVNSVGVTACSALATVLAGNLESSLMLGYLVI